MTVFLSRSLTEPSPSKSNPFARPKINLEPSSFSRSALLPTLIGPHPAPTNKSGNATVLGPSSVGKTRQGWRLLWRGGVEIGKEGWRLDGITFFTILVFPVTTPSVNPVFNPFDPVQTQSAQFPSLPVADTDLCLSLESMRGRKFLQVRGMVDLPADEVLDGAEDGGGVQMSISRQAPLLVAYFTSLLCQNATLSAQGRTLRAVLIGLGDEAVDSTLTSTIMVYGQRSLAPSDTSPPQPTLRLCVARRKAPPLPPSDRKVQPGEPLPRAPLFFPAQAPKRPPPPFARRNGSGSRSLSRNPSVSCIYQPPQPIPQLVPPEPVPDRTAGRKEEKRERTDGERGYDEKNRKSTKVLPSRVEEPEPHGQYFSPHYAEKGQMDVSPRPPTPDEDIFGTRPPRLTVDTNGTDGATTSNGGQEPSSNGRAKRPRVSHRVSDNKAAIRKQTLLLMAERGVHREDVQFRDVFGMTTKGTYFAFRTELDIAPLEKNEIQSIVGGHLAMYLPVTSLVSTGKVAIESLGQETASDQDLDIKPKLRDDLDDPPDQEGRAGLEVHVEDFNEQDEVYVKREGTDEFIEDNQSEYEPG